MGLDIRFSKIIRPLTQEEIELENEGDLEIEYAYVFNPSENFPHAITSIKEGRYMVEHIADMRAGSYSGYNDFRRTLAMVSGLTDRQIWNDPKPEIPFVELINFSDCEGTLDNKCLKELANDFLELEATYMQMDLTDWFRYKYQEWKECLVKASKIDNSVILFY